MLCPHCHGDARFVSYRAHQVYTLNGTLSHSRAYYHCSNCIQGFFPADEPSGLQGHWSPSLNPVVSLLGALVPFATATDLLKRITGLHFSTDTVRRRTESVGHELHKMNRDADVVVPNKLPPWDFRLPDKDGERFEGTVAYLGMDAFAVPTRTPGEVDWKMLYVGLIYDPGKDHTLYLSDYDFEKLAASMRAHACELGVG